jgi:predicted aldo/keto reductase-like oxidoreductase
MRGYANTFLQLRTLAFIRRLFIKYRKFGSLDWEVSALGLGTARLPLDENESVAIVWYAIDHGVNYLEVPYLYDAERRRVLSRFVGKALGDGYRPRVKIAAALPVRVGSSSADFDRYLHEQLEWLGINGIDFGIVGWLDRQNWPELREKGILKWGESALANGEIGNLGFAFHDDYQTLRDILNSYDKWELCQFQYSFVDVDHHPGIGGIRLAAEKGLAIIASGPLKGGRLTSRLPESVATVWGDALKERSPVAWGLRWVWHHPEIATVVSDVGTLAQLKENIALADMAARDSLTIQEQVLINRVRDAYRALRAVSCTACRGCMPCPRNIDVPRIFEVYNDAVMYNDLETARSIYRQEGHDIGVCNECGRCEDACGRNISIIDWLKRARQLFNG